MCIHAWAFQVMLVVKNLSANAGDIGDPGLIPGLGRSPGEGNGYLLQYSCLKNSMDRGTWRACHKKLDTTEHTHTHTFVKCVC